MRPVSSLPRPTSSAFGFSSPAPKVRLVHAFDRPYENVVATARTCYSSKGIITEDQASARPDRRDAIAKSIYEAGHHTTFQHAHFQFALENVSRQFLWTLSPLAPVLQLGAGLPALRGGAAGATTRCRRSGRPSASSTRRRRAPAGGLPTADGAADAARRGAVLRALSRPHARRRPHALCGRDQEAGPGDRALRAARRDLLVPVPHGLRHHALPLLAPVRVHGRAGRAARGRRPDGRGGPASTTRSTPPCSRTRCRSRRRPSTPRSRRCRACAARGGPSAREFDAELGGRVSRSSTGRRTTKRSSPPPCARSSGVPAGGPLGRRRHPPGPRPGAEPLARRDADPDDPRQALARALPPVLHLPQEALAHGRQPGPAPPHDAGLAAGAAGVPLGRAGLHRPDAGRRRRPRRDALYRATMDETWAAIGELRARGVADEFAAYLLPNAVAIRFTESADLLNLHHKFAMRLCYNAQEEIWRASPRRGAARSARPTRASGRGCCRPARCAITPACAPSAPRASASAASSSGNRTPSDYARAL